MNMQPPFDSQHSKAAHRGRSLHRAALIRTACLARLLLPLLLPLLTLPATVQAQCFNYTDNGDGTATITGYTCTNSVVVIPSTINVGSTSLSVSSIGDSAFEDLTSLTSVTIPDNVTNIGQLAFYGCTSLTSLTLGTNLTSIGDFSFGGCVSLTNVTIPASVISLGEVVFDGDTNLRAINVSPGNPAYISVGRVLFNQSQTMLIEYPPGIPETSYIIPSSVTNIGNFAFDQCVSLTSITIPGSVTSIGSHVFYGCTGLTNVTIPNNVTSIGFDAFSLCFGLTTVTIGNGVTNIGDSAFFSSGLTSVTIPASVTSISPDAFGDCMELSAINVDPGNPVFSSADGVLFNKSQTLLAGYPAGKAQNYTIPNSVTNIGDFAFYQCVSLTSITIPNSVTSIGFDAFCGCSGLTNVIIGIGVTNLGADAFYDCYSLTSVTIPGSVTNIGNYAFSFCTSLTNVTIGIGVTTIGYSAFGWCYGLTNVTIPASVNSIGNYAFNGCYSLSGVYFQGNAPTPTNDCSVFSGDNNATVYYLPGTSGWGTTFDCIPAMMLNSPNPAGSLQVTLAPAGASTAGAQWQVDGGIEQPSGATVLGLLVGNHTVSFSSVSGWTTPASQTVYVSANSTATATGVYMPGGQAQCFNYTDNGDGTAIITGYTCTNSVVVIPSTINVGNTSLSVVSIGDEAFFQNMNLTSVTIPNSVTSMGYGVFSGCQSLTNVTIGTNVTTIGDSAFFDCWRFTSVIIPDSVTSIGAAAFVYCTGLTGVTIPNGVTNIGDQAFGGCSSLTAITVETSNSVYSSVAGVLFNQSQTTLVEYPGGIAGSYAIPSSVTNIGDDAFALCTSLTSVTIPGSVTSIGNFAFYNSSLTSVTIPDSVSSIGQAAFEGCGSLTSVTIPSSVTSIGVNAFTDCSTLTAITVSTNNRLVSRICG